MSRHLYFVEVTLPGSAMLGCRFTCNTRDEARQFVRAIRFSALRRGALSDGVPVAVILRHDPSGVGLRRVR